MIAPFLRAFLLLVLTLVDAHLNFTSVIVANWTEVADGPSGREYHAMASLSDGRLLMYGGNTQGKDGLFKCFNDTYIYTPSSFTLSNGKGVTAGGGTWTKVADGPSARYAHAMAPLSDERVLMYGGWLSDEDHNIIFNDAYIYTPSSSMSFDGKGVTAGGGTWTKVADGPSARQGHAMAPLSGGRVLMYGGGDYNIALNDTYIYTTSYSPLSS
jgi:N-acetylneuraminic acid mutarotase